MYHFFQYCGKWYKVKKKIEHVQKNRNIAKNGTRWFSGKPLLIKIYLLDFVLIKIYEREVLYYSKMSMGLLVAPINSQFLHLYPMFPARWVEKYGAGRRTEERSLRRQTNLS